MSAHDNPTYTKPRLVLLCGMVGSGKTTLARKLAEELPAIRLCPDEWLKDMAIDLHAEEPREKLETRFKQLSYELLKLGQNVILEFGFWLRAERDEIRETAHELGATVELRYLDVPAEEIFRRVEARNASDMWIDAPITREQIEHWLSLFQAPTEEELRLFDNPG